MTRSRLEIAAALIGVAAGLVACGGSVDLAGTPNGDGGSGGATTTTTTTNTTTGTGGSGAGTTTGTGGTGAGTTTGTGGGLCDGFEDQHGMGGNGTVTVRIRNDSGQPIYLPANCSTLAYTITPLGGDDPDESYVYDPSCLQTCEDLQTEPPYACGACAPTTFLLPAGATRDVSWNGTGLAYGVVMPEECYAYSEMGITTCSRIVNAPVGDYRIDVVGYSKCDEGFDCTCDSNGVCYGMAGGFEAFPDPAVLSYPSESLVEVVFGVCAFGCAD